MTKFYMTVGLVASGKSTYYKNHFSDDTVYISSDKLREELLGDVNDQSKNSLVFDEMYKRTIAALKEGKNVYYDATNLNRKKRINLLKQLPKCEKIAIMFAIPFETCCKRNHERKRVVPQYVIDRMYKSFQPPHWAEGFDRIEVVKEKSEKDIEDILAENRCCPHDNPHHRFSCGDHCIEASIQAYTIIKDRISSVESDTVARSSIYAVTAAARYHDVSKYKCKVFHNMKNEPTEIAHYYNHENVSAYDFLAHTYHNNDDDNILIANLIANHMIFFSGEGAIQKIKKLYGEDFWKLLEIVHEADLAVH